VRRAALLLVPALALAACGGDDAGTSDPIALESGPTSADPGTDDVGTDDAATDDTATDDAATDDAATDGAEDQGGQTADPQGGVVDASVAEPGTWQVGDAGTVTFSVEDGALVLDDVSPADGWTVTEQEADADEIDVDLERGDETYEFQVELEDDGTLLKVDIDHDVDGAEPGTFELGDAGSVTVSIDGDRLVLDDLTVGDGWEVATREEDDDELEIDLVRGDQRWDLEIELDDGRLDVERDYEVRGRL
jgi:hypothetical protein